MVANVQKNVHITNLQCLLLRVYYIVIMNYVYNKSNGPSEFTTTEFYCTSLS